MSVLPPTFMPNASRPLLLPGNVACASPAPNNDDAPITAATRVVRRRREALISAPPCCRRRSCRTRAGRCWSGIRRAGVRAAEPERGEGSGCQQQRTQGGCECSHLGFLGEGGWLVVRLWAAAATTVTSAPATAAPSSASRHA